MIPIHGLVVSVDYADKLRVCLPRWLNGMETVTIVTCSRDSETAKLADDFDVNLFVTDVFYARGADFNKGAALEEAYRSIPWGGAWLFLFDADVYPPADWHRKLREEKKSSPISPGHLYSPRRNIIPTIEDLELEGVPFRYSGGQPEVPGYGYGQLFHMDDPAVSNRDPLFETHWRHAGNYDDALRARWARPDVRFMPWVVKHIGSPGDNWFGVNKEEKVLEMRKRRLEAGKITAEEHLT